MAGDIFAVLTEAGFVLRAGLSRCDARRSQALLLSAPAKNAMPQGEASMGTDGYEARAPKAIRPATRAIPEEDSPNNRPKSSVAKRPVWKTGG